MERLPIPPGTQAQAAAPPGPACTATATVNGQGIVTGWSDGARRLLGYTSSQIVGQPAARLLAEDIGEKLLRDTAGRERWSGTVALRHRDGHRLQQPLLAHHRTPDHPPTTPAGGPPTGPPTGPAGGTAGRPAGATTGTATAAATAAATGTTGAAAGAAGAAAAGPAGAVAEWLVVCAVPGPSRPLADGVLNAWAFSQSPLLLALFDADLRLLRANAGMQRALALTEDQMRGLRLPDIAPHPASEEAARTMRQALESGQVQHMDACIRPAGAAADTRWPASLAPLKDPDGHVRAVCLSAHPAPHEAPARHTPRAHTTTMALQRSLLPQTLPTQGALDIATRYLPAGSQAGVGGDWFDVIPLSGARVALVVGDVVGHGIRASATMGRVRTAVRTLADVDLPPDELLTHLDDLVNHLAAEESSHTSPADPTDNAAETAGGIGTTCLYAVYDPITRRCTLARAGHPPPATVTPDGTVRFLDVPPGPPLGLGGLPFESYETQLPEGSLLALYTDGLLETRDHDIDEALDTLFAALARPAHTLDTICDRVLTTMLTHRPDDDVALLIARTRALHTDHVATFDLPFDPATVAHARQHATRQLTAWGLDDAAFITELVVSELVTNAIRYGRPPIQLRLIHENTTLTSEVHDASNTTPHMRRARTYDEGGRGLLLIGQLTQRWGTRPTPTGKTVWAEQFLTPE
ncbi:SpoIIE family protein phosphatase [Streptomyces sp. NPDC058251]|uniref:SpoIIE family protein phosphatase n=1 Tax=Streptomyces sp. NPDC058251 TaxID=3346404 RepID=UPI0036E2CA57